MYSNLSYRKISESVKNDLDIIREKVESFYNIDITLKGRYNPLPEARIIFCILVDEIYSITTKPDNNSNGKKPLTQQDLANYLNSGNRCLISYYMKCGKDMLAIDKRFIKNYQYLRIPTFARILKHINYKKEYQKQLLNELEIVNKELRELYSEKVKRYGTENSEEIFTEIETGRIEIKD